MVTNDSLLEQREQFLAELIVLCIRHRVRMDIDNDAWEWMEMPAFVGPPNHGGFMWRLDVADIEIALYTSEETE